MATRLAGSRGAAEPTAGRRPTGVTDGVRPTGGPPVTAYVKPEPPMPTPKPRKRASDGKGAKAVKRRKTYKHKE